MPIVTRSSPRGLALCALSLFFAACLGAGPTDPTPTTPVETPRRPDAAAPARDAALAPDTAVVAVDAGAPTEEAPDARVAVDGAAAKDAAAPDLRVPTPDARVDAALPPKDAAVAVKDAGAPDLPRATPDAAVAVDTAPVVPDASADLRADAAVPGRFFPLKVGATWTYTVTDEEGVAATKKLTVEALEEIGGMKPGVMAFRVRTDKGPDDKTMSWQQDLGNMVVRHREASFKKGTNLVNNDEWFIPHRVRVDERAERLVVGAKWREDYTQHQNKKGVVSTTMESDDWVVDAVDEPVTVPAGTFRCLKLRKVSNDGNPDKIFYWARGVGKVKETGGQTEELASFQIP